MTTVRTTQTTSGGPVKLDRIAGQIQTLQQIREKQRELKEITEQLEQAIKDRLGEAEAGTVGGLTVVRWKHIKRRALSQKLLRELHPAVAEECMELQEVRRFEVLP